MGSIPFAFSVHHFISSVGADAGFASIIGLAVLVLLYFAHARESANLRNQAQALSGRVQELEARLGQLPRVQDTRGAADAATSPATAASAASAAASPARSIQPGPPAGVAAPALNAATKLIPDPLPSAAAAATASAASAAPTAAHAPAAQEEAPAGAGPAVIAPAPATVAGGANGGPLESDRGAPVQAPPPRIPVRPLAAPAPRAPLIPPRAPARRRGGMGRRLPLLVGALLAAVVVVVLVLVTSAGGGKPGTTNAARTSNAPAPRQPHRAPVFNPASVTVTVLNGTATSGLAHRVGARLQTAGYKQGAISTASDQTRTATVVGYMPGHQRDALAVASALKLGSASVQPVDSSTQAVACPPPSACTATVVVTVGSDLASL